MISCFLSVRITLVFNNIASIVEMMRGLGLCSGHPSCLDMSVELMSQIKMYPWQCMECKTCTVCKQPHHEEAMMFCDKCDRGFHTFCVGMDAIPLGEPPTYILYQNSIYE